MGWRGVVVVVVLCSKMFYDVLDVLVTHRFVVYNNVPYGTIPSYLALSYSKVAVRNQFLVIDGAF
ncbi:hypothetical protein OnM2_c3122o14 [Erysiphe neolycopersici]|uniref:Uncharacterized protein n=1 Tax=Erysiphe neolycopersici TaxID=212602 RepID=A0A420HXE7_9PEZI|nr:hypothetical protein OnM2_c3122o14 [Erysiphe neolycopersici]